ncbi:GspH/FimT family pseudopilin [bacterium]|nr:GspH/FimT family pseudopilin [bacterium]
MRIKQHTRAGFSMVELLMVLAIMGIVVTLTISGLLAARPHAQLERADLVVSQTLNQARNHAVSNERAVRVVINIDNNTMTTEEADPGTEDWTEAFPVVELPDGVDFTEDGISFADNTVQFTPRGSLMSGGDIEIVNSADENTVFSGNLATGRFPLSGGHTR